MNTSSTSSSNFFLLKSALKFSDIAGLTEQKQILLENIGLPLKYPQLFTGTRRPHTGFLLYGAPGVGKTALVKACAGEFGLNYILVKTTAVISKFIGDSERLIKEIFEIAEKSEEPVIIIMDEIDIMMPESQGMETPHRFVTEFLIQMDRLHNGKSRNHVLVIGTGNTPWDLYSPVKKRFTKRIYLPLADFQTRKELFEKNFSSSDIPRDLTEDDFSYLAERTEGYSSYDLVILIKNAIFSPVTEASKASHFKKINVEGDENKAKYTACLESDPEAQQMNMMDIPSDQLEFRKITRDDVEKEIQRTKPSVLPTDIERYEKFKEDFGG